MIYRITEKHAAQFEVSLKFFGFFWKLFHTSSSGITKSTKTLIDKIFRNFSQSSEQNISANLTTSSLDQLPDVLFVPGFYRHKNLPKINVFIHDWKAFNSAAFSADYKSAYCPNIIQTNKGSLNFSVHNYFEEVEKIISSHENYIKNEN